MAIVPTYCRICEALCGMLATVEDGRLVQLRPDKDSPHSSGFGCVKGTSMVDVHNDPDRVLFPLKRVGGPGEFERVGWDEALTDIGRRLRALRREHGPGSIAVYGGNPPAFAFSAVFWTKGFQHAVGTPWFYGPNSEDASARVAAAAILYGSPAALPIPDLQRTSFLLMLGANPWVSKGSLINDPRMLEHIDGIVKRGGRVVVVDPRRSETARRFEHVAIRPGTDAWFLLSILHVIFDERLEDRTFVDRWTTGAEEIREVARRHSPEQTERITTVPASLVRRIARELARAPSATVYGRTGTCTQAFGTLANVLQDVVSVVTGNLSRAGGTVFGWSPIPMSEMAEKAGLATYGSVRTRVAGLPDSFGYLPSSALADDIVTPGEGQIRALVMVGANPVLTGPAGNCLEAAFGALKLFVALDSYENETNRHADYLLPTTLMYERPDASLQFIDRMTRPALQVTEAVVTAPGECREEWNILNDIARRMGLGGAYSTAALRLLARLGFEASPKRLADLMIRTSLVGDRFGLRRTGLSWKKLTKSHPHGVVLRDLLPICDLAGKIKHADGRVALADPRVMAEIHRLETEGGREDPEYPFRLIGLREVQSHNSWMHNVARLMPKDRAHAARVHPADAAALGVASGDRVTIRSRTGEIAVSVLVTDEVAPRCIAVPHGWGHLGGWKRANAAGGVNSNLLASRSAADVERLAGMTVLNGIPVRVERASLRGEARGAPEQVDATPNLPERGAPRLE